MAYFKGIRVETMRSNMNTTGWPAVRPGFELNTNETHCHCAQSAIVTPKIVVLLNHSRNIDMTSTVDPKVLDHLMYHLQMTDEL